MNDDEEDAGGGNEPDEMFETGSEVGESDDEDDDEGDGEGSGRRPIVYIAAGVGVLLLGIIGGAAFWYLNNGAEEEVAQENPLPEGAVQMALPPRAVAECAWRRRG